MNRRERAEDRGYDPYDPTWNQRLDPLPPDHPIMQAHAESVRQYHALTRRASQYAAEARARDAARKVREETAREWALSEIAGRYA